MFTITQSIFEINSNAICGYCHGPINKYTITATIDEQKHELIFLGRLIPNKPLLIAFHGWMNNQSYNFYDCDADDLNKFSILCPQDRSGHMRAGSWFLGPRDSEGYFIYPKLFVAFLDTVRKEINPSLRVFMGSSMGGFGALIYSLLVDVDGVVMSVPQTTLDPNVHYFRRGFGNDYARVHPKEYQCPGLKALGISTRKSFSEELKKSPYLDISHFASLITSPSDSVEVNLCSKMKVKASFSNFYHIIGTRYDRAQDINGEYYRHMFLPLQSALLDTNTRFSMNIYPFAGHDAYIFPSMALRYCLRVQNEFSGPIYKNFQAHGAYREWSPTSMRNL